MEARLIPMDRQIALAAGAVITQSQQAKALGIRTDPAADVLARTNAYTQLTPLGRMSRAEFLT